MDYQLIEKARHTSPLYWDRISTLIDQTDDPETIFELERIRAHKYQQEEMMV